MKLKLKQKTFLLFTLGFICVLTTLFANNLNFNKEDNNISKLNNINLKISKVSGKIYINGTSNWVDFKDAGNCTGEGTYSDPYLIENLIIDGGSVESCIWIENSDVYFKIENCTLYNSGIDLIDAGIKLYNVENGQIINNTMYNNFYGIYAEYIDNSAIVGNSFNNYGGIKLKFSNNNLVYLNNLDNDLNLFYMESSNRYYSHQKIKYIYNGYTYTNYLGNYWNEYEEDDNDNNGIGDLPIIFYDSVGEYVDRYPLMEPTENYEIIGFSSGTGEIIPGYNLIFLIGMICVISIFLLKKAITIQKGK
ncbi:MAG: NosD domain-containing protein [Promethearchaeota archaeon]